MYVRPTGILIKQRSPYPTPFPQAFPAVVNDGGTDPNIAQPIQIGGGVGSDDSPLNSINLVGSEPTSLAVSDGAYDDPTTHTVQQQDQLQSSTSTPSTLTSTSTSSSSSPTSSTINDDNPSHSGFKLVYLIPLFVLMGLFLLFSVGGKIWGKVWHKKEKEIRRAEKRARRAAKRERMKELERIKQGWIENGNGERRASTDQWLKYEVDNYAGNIDGSAGNYNGNGINGEGYKGVFGSGDNSSDDYTSDEDHHGFTSKLGLGGHSKSKSRSRGAGRRRRDGNQFATTRTRNGKWENEIQSNNWLSRVKMGINNFGGEDHQHHQDHRGDYTSPTEDGRVNGQDEGLQRKPTLRASLKGTWNRIKKSIAWNVGWGYSGASPGVHTRRRLMRNPPSNGTNPSGLWGGPLPHTSSGLFFPPKLSNSHRSNRDQALPSSSSRHSEDGDDSIPLLEDLAPPTQTPVNTMANLNDLRSTSIRDMISTGGNIINAAWKAVTTSNSRSQMNGNRHASGGRHERLRTSDSDYDLPIHQHPPGQTCELDVPQHLPPASVISLSRRNSEINLEDVEQVIEIPLRRGASKKSSSRHSKQSSTSTSSGAIIFGSPTKMSPTKVSASSRPGTSYWPEAFNEEDEPISPTSSSRNPVRSRTLKSRDVEEEEPARPWKAKYISSTARAAISPPVSPTSSTSRLPTSPTRLTKAATNSSVSSGNRIRGDPNGSPVKRGSSVREARPSPASRMTSYDSEGERLIFAGSSASTPMMMEVAKPTSSRSITRSKTMGARSSATPKQSSPLKRSGSRATISSVNSSRMDENPQSSTPRTPSRSSRKSNATNNSQNVPGSNHSSPCRLPRAPPPSCADLLSFAQDDEDEDVENSNVNSFIDHNDSPSNLGGIPRTKSSSKNLASSGSRTALARVNLENRNATASETEPSDFEDAPSLSSGASSSGDSDRSVKTVIDRDEGEISVSYPAGLSFGDESHQENHQDRSFNELQNDLSLGQISISSNNDKSNGGIKTSKSMKSLSSRKDLPNGNVEGEDEFMCAVARLGEGTNAIDEVLAQLGSGTEAPVIKKKKSSTSIKENASAKKKSSSNNLKKSKVTQDENDFSTPTKSLPKHIIGDDSTCSTPRSVRNGQSSSTNTPIGHSPSISNGGGTPLTRKKTWQQKNGRWFRIAEDGSVICRGIDGSEMLESETWSPKSNQETESPRPEKDFVSPMTGHSGPGFGMRASLRGKDNKSLISKPPSLPPPPQDSQLSDSNSFSTTTTSPLPKSLQISSPVALTPGKLQGFSSLSTSNLNALTSPSVPGLKSEDIFASPPSVYSFATTAFSPPVGSPLHTASLASSSSKSSSPSRFKRTGTSDLTQGATFSSFGAAALSVKKTNDLKRGSVDSGTSSEDGGYGGIQPLNGDSNNSPRPSSPKRRAALLNRPPKRYQAALSGSSISSSHSSTTSTSTESSNRSDGELSTKKNSSPKSHVKSSSSASRRVKSPAQRERERKEALDKVNHVINSSLKQQK